MSKYIISEVVSKRDLRRFIKFPDELYRNCPQYVPALHSDQVHSLTKAASLSYCTSKMWLVYNEKGRVVGRICAMINPRYNERYSKKNARFGWFDTIDDIEVARLLISTAEAWAKEQGMDTIHGPLYYNTLGKQGMLVEGFENTPPFNCIYNYPYYVDMMQELGFEKECDWVQYKLDTTQTIPEKVFRISALLQQKYSLHPADIDKLKKDKEMVRKFFHVYNDAFAAAVYNFVPFTDEEIDEEMASTMKFVTNKSGNIIMDEDNNVVAFGIYFPSISEALKKAKGHVFPFGWYHLLKALNHFELTDLMINGAAPEWQGRGISAVYFTDNFKKAAASGMHYAITNPTIETNSAVNIWNSYEHELYMRRRCYIKPIK